MPPRWRVQRAADVMTWLLPLGPPTGRPHVIGIDGRSGAGKSTVAETLRGHARATVVVHTDDVAWYESFFGWETLLAQGVLEPARRGEPVAFRPPAWSQRGRAGAIEVPPTTRVLIVEGVGACRHELTSLLDALVWVESDREQARRRGILRDGGDAAAETFWDEWDAEEVPFLERQRPWERANLWVNGTPTLEHDPASELEVATPAR